MSADLDGSRAPLLGTLLADIDRPTSAPEQSADELLDVLARTNRERRRWIVVLDDDPTGTQTVRDVPVVLGEWTPADLEWASTHDSGVTVVLTNSRSLDPDRAAELTAQAITTCAAQARERSLHLTVISRSDSTLRGHFRRELDAAADALATAGFPINGVVFAPCFLEAGRYTADNIQWGCVRPIDLLTFTTAAFDAENAGLRFLYRTGPTAVRILAAQPTSQPLATIEQSEGEAVGAYGLVVVGSHTELTNRQLFALGTHHAMSTVELDLGEILADDTRADAECERCAGEVIESMAKTLTVLQTTRAPVSHDPANPLRTTRAIAAAVNRVVRQACTVTTPRFLVAKGGITSHDLAAISLACTRAEVIGQLFPGKVSVWRLHNGRAPDLPYVVFPGNVGADSALADAISILTQKDSR